MTIVCGTLLDGPVRLTYRLAGPDLLGDHLLALQRFGALQTLDRRTMDPTIPPRAERRVLLLQTLDALARSSSLRSIAAAIYGSDLVEAEWVGRSDFLKSRVRRLIAQARLLAAGGYRAEVRCDRASRGAASLFPSPPSLDPPQR